MDRTNEISREIHQLLEIAVKFSFQDAQKLLERTRSPI